MATFNPFERPAPAAADPPVAAPVAAPAEPAAPVRHEDVVARVRELLGKYPTLGSRQLYDLAIRMHPDVEAKGFRSFHARYVLPLKREKARAEGRLPKPRTPKPAKAAKAVEKPPRKVRAPRAEAVPSPAPAVQVESPQVRQRIREVLLRLVKDVAVAESRADLVDALAKVEDMVDEVLRAVRPANAAGAEARD